MPHALEHQKTRIGVVVVFYVGMYSLRWDCHFYLHRRLGEHPPVPIQLILWTFLPDVITTRGLNIYVDISKSVCPLILLLITATQALLTHRLRCSKLDVKTVWDEDMWWWCNATLKGEIKPSETPS